MTGIDPGSFLLGAAIVLLVFIAIDLLIAGGGMTAGMMGGMAGMMGTPWGWLVLVLLIAASLVVFAGR